MARLPLHKWWLQRVFLPGVKQTDDAGNPFSDALYRHAIAAAVDRLRIICDIELLPRRFSAERHDYDPRTGAGHHFLRLDQRPILQDETDYPLALRFRLGNVNVFNVPDSWIVQIIQRAGQLELVPVAHDAGSYPVTGAGVWFGMYTVSAGGRLPGWYEADYWAGFPVGDMNLINDLVSDLTWIHESHRLEVRGSPPVHSAADTTNTLLANGGTPEYIGETEDEAIVQANAVKAAYMAHIADDTVHGQADAINVITSPDATDRETLCTLLNELRFQMGVHLVYQGPDPVVHGVPDTTRAVTAGPVFADAVLLPEDILSALGMMASLYVLNPAGDLIAGAGIASKSIGIDALHQSINTTSSATNAGYGARIIQYQKDLKPLLKEIRSEYHGVQMAVM